MFFSKEYQLFILLLAVDSCWCCCYSGSVIFVVLYLFVLGRRQHCCCFRSVVTAVYSCHTEQIAIAAAAAVFGSGSGVMANGAALCWVCFYWVVAAVV